MKALAALTVGVLYVAAAFGTYLVLDAIDDAESPIANKGHAAAIWIVMFPLFGALLARDALRERLRK